VQPEPAKAVPRRTQPNHQPAQPVGTPNPSAALPRARRVRTRHCCARGAARLAAGEGPWLSMAVAPPNCGAQAPARHSARPTRAGPGDRPLADARDHADEHPDASRCRHRESGAVGVLVRRTAADMNAGFEAARNTKAGPQACLVVIPALNEEASVAQVVHAVRRIVPDASVVVIDDGSRDATSDVARAAGTDVIVLPF